MITRALLSVSDKTGIVDFARFLAEKGIELLSTGGTKKAIEAAGIPVKEVSEHTGFPEMLDGRVKTLHPMIHAGLLFVRGNEMHEETISQHGILPIDLVVVNLYPFGETVQRPNVSDEEVIEQIDIGGPSMLRSAAKNFAAVTVVTDPADYAVVQREIADQNDTTLETRRKLAAKVFSTTAQYDAMIAKFFDSNFLMLRFEKRFDLRYGENPHQQAAFYKDLKNSYPNVTNAQQHQGKELSYNNIVDADAAFSLVKEFSEPAVSIIKHANPCGVATGKDVVEAYEKAYAADTKSPFGGVVAMNRTCTKALAEKLLELFLEIVIAPSFEPEALKLFEGKSKIRILETGALIVEEPQKMLKSVGGGLLMQDRDHGKVTREDLTVVTKKAPTDAEIDAMLFAWPVVKHARSNAIVLAKKNVSWGIGAGQTSRVDAVDIAVKKAGEHAKGCIMASDAFFPFSDGIESAVAAGVTAVIHPGGSIRDSEVIARADELGIAMVFCGKRAFLH